MNSSDDEGLMDFVMKKDISKGGGAPAQEGTSLPHKAPGHHSFGMMKHHTGGGGVLGHKFHRPNGQGGKAGHMFIGKTLSIHKSHRPMKSLNLSALGHKKIGKYR